MHNAVPKTIIYLIVICVVSCTNKPPVENNETVENQPIVVSGKGIVMANAVKCGYLHLDEDLYVFCAAGQRNIKTNEFTVHEDIKDQRDIIWLNDPSLNKVTKNYLISPNNIFISFEVTDVEIGEINFNVTVENESVPVVINFSDVNDMVTSDIRNFFTEPDAAKQSNELID